MAHNTISSPHTHSPAFDEGFLEVSSIHKLHYEQYGKVDGKPGLSKNKSFSSHKRRDLILQKWYSSTEAPVEALRSPTPSTSTPTSTVLSSSTSEEPEDQLPVPRFEKTLLKISSTILSPSAFISKLPNGTSSSAGRGALRSLCSMHRLIRTWWAHLFFEVFVHAAN